VNSILHLQRTIGNQAVLRMLQAHAGGREAGLTATAITSLWARFQPDAHPSSGSRSDTGEASD
jgi:hypothetical protein